MIFSGSLCTVRAHARRTHRRSAKVARAQRRGGNFVVVGQGSLLEPALAWCRDSGLRVPFECSLDHEGSRPMGGFEGCLMPRVTLAPQGRTFESSIGSECSRQLLVVE